MKSHFLCALLTTVICSNVAAFDPLRDSAGKILRSRAAVAKFKSHNACPITGRRVGACVGYVVDHKQPLCADGVDAPENMQWQTIDLSRKKDRIEIALCSGRISQGAYNAAVARIR